MFFTQAFRSSVSYALERASRSEGRLRPSRNVSDIDRYPAPPEPANRPIGAFKISQMSHKTDT